MATITKNVPPPPETTVDIVGLTVAEYMAIWNGLVHLAHGTNTHNRYGKGGAQAAHRNIPQALLEAVSDGDPR